MFGPCIRYGAAAALSGTLLLATATGVDAAPGATATAAAAPLPDRPAPSADRTASTAPELPARDADWTVEDALRFWTPERMASATDPTGRDAVPRRPRAARPFAAKLTAEHFPGVKSVGMLFNTAKGMQAHHCSAAVVRSAQRNMILTAGHCVGDHAVFVPMYDRTKPAAEQPYGIWPVDQWFRDKRYASDKSVNSDLDFAFATLKPNGTRRVEDAVGANTLARTPGLANTVTVVGYPMTGRNPQDQAVRCPEVSTAALPHYHQMQITCAGMWGGVSGGPWFSAFDASGDTGTIIGNVGGFNGGGPDVSPSDPRYNEITYSPLYGDRFFQLYTDAQSGINPDHGPYGQSPLPFGMGSAATWKHAKLMASGDFGGSGHSDLLVVWDDGAVSLYADDGNGRFVGERALLAQNSLWRNAASVTAGDFAGSDRFDLLVRWVDGEVTLYPDIRNLGLDRPGTRMSPRNGIWKNATQFAAGRFGSSKYVTDLVVRWSDGEVTLYTGVSDKSFGRERTLKKHNPVWKTAAMLTSGQFAGTAGWDLLAQWPDGSVTAYSGTTAAGLGTERRILPGNTLWKQPKLTTTGDFTPNHRTDDLVVRWPDGRTVLYPDTTPTRLGIAETSLVDPA